MERKIMRQLLYWRDKSVKKPLLLQGARQVGKTYLLKQFGKDHFTACHYFDLEEQKDVLSNIFEGSSLDPKVIVDKLSFVSGKVIDTENDILILDEIQAVPRALTALKYFCQDMPQLAVAAAGSNLGVATSSEPFPVGKVECLTLLPLNFEEFLAGTGEILSLKFLDSFHGGQIDSVYHQKLFEQLKTYFVTGGLPEVVQEYANNKEAPLIAFRAARELQQQLLLHYESDFSKYSGSTNSRHIERVFKAIPSQLSRFQERKSKKFKFKDVISKGYRSYEDLADPIDWLIKAGLALKVNINQHPSLPIKAGAVENSFKLFLFDIGLLGAMNNLSPESIMLYDYGSYKGYFSENFILQELYSYGISNIVTWVGRTSEIEFVAEIDNQIIPIEVKAGVNTKAKSLQAFIDKYKPFYSIKFSGNRYGRDHHRKIDNYPLYMVSKFPELSKGLSKNARIPRR